MSPDNMTGNDHPHGAPVPGPSTVVPNLSPHQSPRHSPHPPAIPSPTPTTTVTHVSDTELVILKDLIEHTESNNIQIQKLNHLHQLLCDDLKHINAVSDDEEEDHLPVASSYMHPELPPSPAPNPDLRSSNPLGLSSIALGKCPASSIPPSSFNAAPVDWCSLMSTSNQSPIDYHSLPPIFSDTALTKELKVHVTSIPTSILQMALNKLYIPLSMLTTSALNRIRNNENLKFKRSLSAMAWASNHLMTPSFLLNLPPLSLSSFNPIETGLLLLTPFPLHTLRLAGMSTMPKCSLTKTSTILSPPGTTMTNSFARSTCLILSLLT
ncbi:hypothetical protein K439DRAFT_1611770 [Ramaria rubella]|nr:hypothetical protein K439DRAFT_1611770 [Ramaria rubella]